MSKRQEVQNIFTSPTLRQQLAAHVAAWSELAKAQGLDIKGPGALEGFILRHANVEGRGQRTMPYGMARGRPKNCFQNAYREADAAGIFTYCEGFAMREALGIPIHHAWLVNMRGLIYDPTLRDAHQYEYLGITVSYPVLHAETERTGVYGLLEPGVGLNKEFMDRYEKS